MIKIDDKLDTYTEDLEGASFSIALMIDKTVTGKDLDEITGHIDAIKTIAKKYTQKKKS
jgi:hypothetical protein